MSEHAGERERGRGKNIVWVEGRETREGNKRGMGRTEGGMGRTEGGKKGGRVEERKPGKREEVGQDDIR